MSKAAELRKLTVEELTNELNETKGRLQEYFQKKHSKKVNPYMQKKIKKEITRIMTVLQEKRLEDLCNKYSGKKFIPKELRPKLTRAKRRTLSPKQEKLRNLTVRKRSHARLPEQLFAFIPQ